VLVNGTRNPGRLALAAAVALVAGPEPARAEPVGPFQDHGDIGSPARTGAASFDQTTGRYTVTGGGENMWHAKDALHFVWKQITGDITLAADITFPTQRGNPHRKACLLVRQSLDADSAYADAALHGDGLTSLQYRESAGALTHEIQSNVSGPRRLRLEKRGNYVSMSLASEGGELRPSGGSFRLELREPFYVGLGVCAHNDKALETAVFSGVQMVLGPPEHDPAIPKQKPVRISTLETITVASTDRRVVWHTRGLIEAPNWSRTGDLLYFNAQGRIHRIPVTGGAPELIDTGFAIRCNNDHGLSPDGTQLVISDQSQDDRRSRIHVLPVGGGMPRLITPNAPSYWHGWSPDGQTLVYCAERGGEFDVYAIPANGGAERRLTTATGLDDGPDYSPDGKFIYFNSDRTGTMHVWRMKPDGSEQVQVTTGDDNNWFPHPSPDGKLLVFLTYAPDVKGHPEDKDVSLRLLTLGTGQVTTLAKLFGGQGTINIPSWSPDSKKLAFVSYQLVDYPSWSLAPTPNDLPPSNIMSEDMKALAAIVAKSRSRADHLERIFAMHRLMIEWSPIGLSRKEVSTLLGEPTHVHDHGIEYRIDSGGGGWTWMFGIDKGVISKVTKTSLD
jgi:TolB protein